MIWVFGYLGGVGFAPVVKGENTNDPGVIFNWHPLFMAMAFPICMAEAVLAYRAPLATSSDKPQRKVLHVALQSAALVFIILGLITTIKSHTLKRPTPIPNFYSPHSWMGLFTTSLAVLQYVFGFYAFAFPKMSQTDRSAAAPIHAFLGQAVLVLGLATMTTGIQEKTTLVQTLMKPAGGMRTAYFTLPALLELLIMLTGILVLFHHKSVGKGKGDSDAQQTFLEEGSRGSHELGNSNQ